MRRLPIFSAGRLSAVANPDLKLVEVALASSTTLKLALYCALTFDAVGRLDCVVTVA